MEFFQTSIKIPVELYEKLKADANEQERNITGEIIYICKQYFKQQEK